MYTLLWKVLLLAPAVWGASMVFSTVSLANETPTTEVTKTLKTAKKTANATATDALVRGETVAEIKLKKPAVAQDLKPTIPATTMLGAPAVAERTEKLKAGTETLNTPAAAIPRYTIGDASTLKPTLHYSNQDYSNQDYSKQGNFDGLLGQVTNVTQLRDVQPGDWAYQALQSLVERYGCIAGYPDGTFRGNRALTRYEFAAGLNACLDRVNELIAAATSDLVRREDLATLQRLQEEFAAELATLRGRVDTLEAVTAELEANQFSTTTQLNGEIVLGLTGIVSGESVFGEDVDDVTILGARTRLNLDTSFTGRDQLRTRLQAFGLDNFTGRTRTFEGNLAFAALGEDANNDVEIDKLTYSFPIGTSTQVVLAANNAEADDFASTLNFLDGEEGAFGALSRFGTRNPIYYLVEGSGIGIRQQLGRSLELSLGYLAGNAGDPNDDGGLFNGSYGALAQLVFKPSDRFQIGFTYINSYNRETLTGSPLSNPRTLISNLANQPVNVNFQAPAIPGIPRFFPANQPIALGELLPAGTQLPIGTRLNTATTLPFPVTVPAPLLGTITIPAGTTIPAGIALSAPITLPIDLPLPASITLPTNLTLPAAAVPALPPIAFNGNLGDFLSQPEFAGIPLGFDLNIPIVSNSYGIELSWQVADNFVLGGWVGYTVTTALSTGNGLLSRGNIDTINGAITLAFPDLGKKGNLGGIIVGVEPTVLNADIEVNENLAAPATLGPALIAGGLALLNAAPAIAQIAETFENADPDVSLHVEAFYQIQLTDNIAITPGVIWITAPGSLANNQDLVIGTIRTTFRF